MIKNEHLHNIYAGKKGSFFPSILHIYEPLVNMYDVKIYCDYGGHE